MSKRTIVAAVASLVLVVLSQTKTVVADKVVIAYPTTSSQFAPLWFAKDVGIYQKYGLDPQLVYIRGFNLIQGMLADQVNLAQTAVAGTLLAILRGADLRFVAITAKIFPYTLVAAKNIKTVDDLKGGKIAINRLADVSEIASKIALRKLGMNPDRDVTMLQVGGSPDRLAALQSGSVQAAALDFMSGIKMSKEGYNVLARLNLNYPYLGLLAPRKFMKENPDATENFVKAFVESVARFRRNREEGIKVISKYMKSNEMDLVTQAYDFIAKDFYADNLEPDPEGFKLLLEELGAREPRAKSASMDQFVDLTIIRKLEKEGFFKKTLGK
ncbi:MAG: ABC transporter substrate-binding protein [Candidatus Binatia bacterium]